MKKKVLLIVISGASEDIVDYLVKSGRMPNLSSLIKKGMSARLVNKEMLDTDIWERVNIYREYVKKIPLIGRHPDISDWASLASGVSSRKHHLDVSLKPDSRNIMRVLSLRHSKYPLIWDLLIKNKKKVGVIGWHGLNWPLKGSEYCVCNYPLDSKNGYIYPSGIKNELREMYFDKTFLEQIAKRAGYYYRGRMSGLIMRDGFYMESAKYLLKKYTQPDLLSVGIHEIHNLSHLFWDCLEMNRKMYKSIIHKRRRKAFKGIIEDYYDYIDDNIGEILKLINKNTIVFVISEHGMVPLKKVLLKKYFLMNKIYSQINLLSYKKDASIDWSSTAVYDDENPWGILAIRKGYIKKRPYRRMFRRLKKELEMITTGKGDKVFKEVKMDSENSFTVIPDYRVIKHNSKIIIRGIAYNIKEFVSFKPHYSLHGPYGIFICKGAKFKRGINEVSLYDMAPTILSLLDVNVKNFDFDGNVVLG